MPEHGLSIKGMWTVFNSNEPTGVVSAFDREVHRSMFYSGAIGMYLLLTGSDATPELIEDLLQEINTHLQAEGIPCLS